jgi:hypothetical protein
MNKPLGVLAVVLLIGQGVPALAASHGHSHGGHHSGHGHSTHGHSTHGHSTGSHSSRSGASSATHHTTNHSKSRTHSSSSSHHLSLSPSTDRLLPPCNAEDAAGKDAKDKTERNCRG